MIDLGALKAQRKLYEIKLEDGSILHVKTPSQKMYVSMVNMSNIGNLNAIEQMDFVYEVCVDIFNNNTENRNFTKEEITEMFDFNIAAYIIQDYFKEINETLGKS